MKKKLYSQVKVIEAFKANNINIEVLNLSVSTKTSKEAANAVGCNLSQIAKSIVFYEVDHKRLVQIFVKSIEWIILFMNPILGYEWIYWYFDIFC